MKTLSLVVPIYNEEKTLFSIVEKINKLQEEQYLKENNIGLEIVLVDDCSSDNSFSIAKELETKYSNIKVFKNPKNMGKGKAVRTGFSNATGDFIGIQDADDEYNPLEYTKLLKPILENNADVVYGSRYLKQDTRRILYFWHTFMNKGLTLLTNMYTNLDITDMETCYKLFKKEVIKKLLPTLKENCFGFEPEITIKIAEEHYKIYECAISYNPRSYEEGKKIKAKDGFHALYCILHYGAHKAPIPMQFILYIFIGGISAIVNILTFVLLARVCQSLIANVAVSFIVASIVNYLLCILLLFRHNARWSSLMEIVTYVITLGIMGCVDYYSTYLFLLLGFNSFWAKSFSNIIGLFGNFLLRKYFVFLEKKK